MNESRLTLLPDQTLGALLPTLKGRLALVGNSIDALNFGSVLDGAMTQLFHSALNAVGATEGSIWLLEPATASLTIAYNTGPYAQLLVGKFKQPLNAGLISMVFSSEQSFIENEIYKNSAQDKKLDSLLQVRTYAMIAVPFYFLRECRGVASCVQLIPAMLEALEPKGFKGIHETVFRNAAVVLGRMIEHWAVSQTIGLE
jgi:hypothetical protein